MPLIHRFLTDNILEALNQTPIVFINGPRQAGKSTLVQLLAKQQWPATYITLDDTSQLGAASANPEIFLKAHGDRIIIDEVQMVPLLFRSLKIIVDELRLSDNQRANGRYLLTGSTNIMALPELSNALVGRMEVITLYPLSTVEITSSTGTFLHMLFSCQFSTQKYGDDIDLVDMIRQATFPEITDASDKTRQRWFNSYITTILQRDVRQIADIEKLGMLPNLLRVLAARAGGLINEADIARSIGQNATTTKNYRLLLQMMFLTFDVKPWFRNIGKRLVKAPKGYLIDTSLLCHLQQIDLKQVALQDPNMFGHVLENFIASELLKQLTYFDTPTELLHFRTSDNKEVDFVLQKSGGMLAGIEVKAKDHVDIRDFKGLKELETQAGKDFACGVVLYRGKSAIPFSEKLWALPISMLWT